MASEVDSTTSPCDPPTAPHQVMFGDLRDLEVSRVLANSTEEKWIALEGFFKGKEGAAVVTIEKPAFSEDKLDEVFNGDTHMKLSFNNAEYYQKIATLKHNDVRVKIIYPAGEEHIRQFEKPRYAVFRETPSLHHQVTRPFIAAITAKKEWVEEQLSNDASEGVVYNEPHPDDGFVVVRDLKWCGEAADDLSVLAVLRTGVLNSLRDLRGAHLPLLKNVYEKTMQAIKDKYGLGGHRVRAYIRYPPTTPRLTVHFTALTAAAPGTSVGQAHLLADVMSTLDTTPDYYAHATLSLTLDDTHPLHATLHATTRNTPAQDDC